MYGPSQSKTPAMFRGGKAPPFLYTNVNLKHIAMQDAQSLIEFAKSKGAVSLDKVSGPNGAFISMVDADGGKTTLPIGKRSQDGSLADYKILITDDGQAIATVNNYNNVESMTLA